MQPGVHVGVTISHSQPSDVWGDGQDYVRLSSCRIWHGWKHVATGGASLMPGNAALVANNEEFFHFALRAIATDELGSSEAIETASLNVGNAVNLRAVRECFEHPRVAVVSSGLRVE